MIRMLDLFSGIGAFPLAARNIGDPFVFSGYSEIDPFCLDILQHNFPGVENVGDIREFFPGKERHYELVTAGPPCQPWSFAGPRKQESDNRDLFDEWKRIVTATLPRFLLLENVTGLTASKTFLALQVFLENQGYQFVNLVVPALAYGAPYLRKRLFVIGEIVRDDKNGGQQAKARITPDGNCYGVEKNILEVAYHNTAAGKEAARIVDNGVDEIKGNYTTWRNTIPGIPVKMPGFPFGLARKTYTAIGNSIHVGTAEALLRVIKWRYECKK